MPVWIRLVDIRHIDAIAGDGGSVDVDRDLRDRRFLEHFRIGRPLDLAQNVDDLFCQAPRSSRGLSP